MHTMTRILVLLLLVATDSQAQDRAAIFEDIQAKMDRSTFAASQQSRESQDVLIVERPSRTLIVTGFRSDIGRDYTGDDQGRIDVTFYLSDDEIVEVLGMRIGTFIQDQATDGLSTYYPLPRIVDMPSEKELCWMDIGMSPGGVLIIPDSGDHILFESTGLEPGIAIQSPGKGQGRDTICLKPARPNEWASSEVIGDWEIEAQR